VVNAPAIPALAHISLRSPFNLFSPIGTFKNHGTDEISFNGFK